MYVQVRFSFILASKQESTNYNFTLTIIENVVFLDQTASLIMKLF